MGCDRRFSPEIWRRALNAIAQRPFINSQCTNAGWPLVNSPAMVILGGFLVAGTAISQAPTAEIMPLVHAALVRQTSAGVPADQNRKMSGAASVNRLRRLTGLTWEQLGHMLAISRRSVHSWASGARLAAANEERLARTVAAMEAISRGIATSNRAMLLSPVGDNHLLIDLFREGRYEDAASVAAKIGLIEELPGERGQALVTGNWNVAHLDAQQEPIHVPSKQVRVVRAIRLKPMA